MINPGKLNKYIAFKRQNDDGTYTTVAEAWADIKPLSASQFVQAKAVYGEITHEIHIRYRTDITRELTIFHGNRQFEFETPPINVDEKGQYLRFMCKEVNV